MSVLREKQLNCIGALAVEAMLYEVSATPKPGLVDRKNNGAHHDMDFFTFMSSASALRNVFDKFALAGAEFYKGHSENAKDLLAKLIPIGKAAEAEMYRMTGNVNTHKGMIFSLGVLAGAAGYLMAADRELKAQNLAQTSGEICENITFKAYGTLKEKIENSNYQPTKGEAMYLKYGVKGVRGEAEDGYPSVLKIALPEYKRLRKNYSVNDTLVGTLIALLAHAGDTNILGRHDMSTLEYVKKEAKKILALGSVESAEGRKEIEVLDKAFIKAYISPGGSADLIAVTHFIYSLENMAQMS